jgi:hypothetical protein
MKMGFNLPSGGGTWTQEAANYLVGQDLVWEGKAAKVIDCHVTEDGALKGTVEVSEVNA